MSIKSESITLRMSPEEHAALLKKASDWGMSASAFIRLIARAEIEIRIRATGHKED